MLDSFEGSQAMNCAQPSRACLKSFASGSDTTSRATREIWCGVQMHGEKRLSVVLGTNALLSSSTSSVGANWLYLQEEIATGPNTGWQPYISVSLDCFGESNA